METSHIRANFSSDQHYQLKCSQSKKTWSYQKEIRKVTDKRPANRPANPCSITVSYASVCEQVTS